MTADEPALRTNRSAGLTLTAAVVAGAQALIIIVLSKWSLPDDAFTPVAQLWAVWAVTAASFNYGFQQWSAVRKAGVGTLSTRAGRPVLAALTLIGVVIGISTFVLRERLFATDAPVWPLFAALLPLGTALVGLNRGELARDRRIRALALVIAGENSIRLALTIVLAAVGAPAWTFGAALLGGFAISMFPGATHAHRVLPPTRPLAVAVSAGLAAHVLLFGAPLILAIGGGSPDDVVALFVILSAVRAPFVLFQGLVPLLAVRFGADRRGSAQLVRSLVATGIALALVAFGVGALTGDAVVGTAFSIRGDVSDLTYGLVGATAMISVTLAVVTIRLVATSEVRPIVIAWSLPVAATAVAMTAGILDELDTTARWILVCHLLAVAIVVAATAGTGSSSRFRSPDSLRGRSNPPTSDHR